MQHLLLPSALALAVALTGCQTIDDVRNELFPSSSDAGAKVEEHQNNTLAVVAPQVANTENTTASGLVLPQSVIDGDTIELEGKRIRLFGIDAPEKSQPCQVQETTVACGIIARNALIGFVAGATVRCDRKDVDRYGRDVSRCYVEGYDLSAGMVRAGLAVAYRQYSLSYVSEEETAKRLKRGMWKGSFVMPWDWRSQGSQ